MTCSPNVLALFAKYGITDSDGGPVPDAITLTDQCDLLALVLLLPNPGVDGLALPWSHPDDAVQGFKCTNLHNPIAHFLNRFLRPTVWVSPWTIQTVSGFTVTTPSTWAAWIKEFDYGQHDSYALPTEAGH